MTLVQKNRDLLLLISMFLLCKHVRLTCVFNKLMMMTMSIAI